MSESARVESIDAIKQLKLSLIKFGTLVKNALADVETDLQRTIMWLELEQTSHWTNQIRKRQEQLSRAKDALRQKTIFKDSTGSRPSVVDEQKMVKQAEAALAHATEKLANTRKYIGVLQKESTLYKGKVQMLYNAVELDLPVTAAKLEKHIQALDAYTHLELTSNEVESVSLSEDQAPSAAPAPQAPNPTPPEEQNGSR